MRSYPIPFPLANPRAVAVLLALSVSAGAQFTPAPGSPFAAGTGPASVAVGDFNGDGIPDLAIADFSGGTVTVLMGNGTGSFAPFPAPNNVAIPVGPEPASVAVFTYGGHACLAVANEGSGTVTVLLGDGTGKFNAAAGSPYTVGSEPVSIAASVYNNNVILAVANFGSMNVTVLTQTSSGPNLFGASGTYTVGKNPSSVAIADFNHDGIPDLAVANKFDSTVSVLLGEANGTFNTPGNLIPVIPLTPPVQPTAYPVSLAVADFNGDGKLDLAVANEGLNSVTVLLGNGTGGFAAVSDSTPIPVGSAPFFVATGFFNSDTIPDLVVANEGNNNVSVLLGNGAGGFLPAAFNPFTPDPGSPFAVGTAPVSVAVADFNGDGKPDLAVANEGSNNLTVLLNGIYTPVTVSAASYTAPVAIGSIVSIFGIGLASAAATATTVPLPVTLGATGATITYSNMAQDELPLFYASPAQINALIPADAVAGLAMLTVYSAAGSQSGPVMITSVAPSLFSANGAGQGVAAAQFVAYPSLAVSNVFECTGGVGTCVAVPLNVTGGQSQLVLYGTGIRNASQVTVTIGNQPPQPPTFFGPSPNNVGEDQVNVKLPANLPSGLTQVSVSAGGLTSNFVTIYIQ